MAAVRRGNSAVVLIIAICVLIELFLSASDARLGLSAPPREIVLEYAAFWPGLLGSWAPNYPLQPYTMFVTYAFLHGGLIHLIVNVVSLWSLGPVVVRRVGPWGFLAVYFASVVIGALVFGLLAPNLRPMVGASGALFGLAGAILSWTYIDRHANQQGIVPVLQAVILLILLNLVLWWAMSGQLAWQTHLGGFIGGWLVAVIVDPRPVDPDARRANGNG